MDARGMMLIYYSRSSLLQHKVCLLQDSNLMNSVITDMYKKKHACADVGSGSALETAVLNSDGLSYCIDRTGVESVRSLLESDQRHRSITSSDDVRSTAAVDRESTADDVVVIEDSRDRDTNSNTSVNVPQPLPTVDINKDHCCAEEKLTVTDLHSGIDHLLDIPVVYILF